MWPAESRMTFPEALCLRKLSVNHLMYKSVLMYDDIRFTYTSDPVGKPSPNSCFLLTSVNIRRGAEIDMRRYRLPSL